MATQAATTANTIYYSANPEQRLLSELLATLSAMRQQQDQALQLLSDIASHVARSAEQPPAAAASADKSRLRRRKRVALKEPEREA